MVNLPASTSGTHHDGMGPSPAPNIVKNFSAKFRLTAVETGKEGIHLQKILFDVMTKMRQVDDAIVFKDIHGKDVKLTEWETIKPGDFNFRFGVVTHGGKKPEAMLGFEARASMSANIIRRQIFKFLQQNKIFLRTHHTLTWQALDVVNIGFLFKVNPKFADHEETLKEVQKMLLQAQNDHMISKCESYSDAPMPEMFLQQGSPSFGEGDEKVYTHAIGLYVHRPHVEYIQYLLNSIKEPKIQVILRSFKYSDPELFAQALNQQNYYVNQHRNVPVAGISVEAMLKHKVTCDGTEWNSAKEAILAVNGVTAAHHSKRIYDLGKWNVSTTSDKAKSVADWMDKHLAKLINTIPMDTTLSLQVSTFHLTNTEM